MDIFSSSFHISQLANEADPQGKRQGTRDKYPLDIVLDRANKFTSKEYFSDVNLLSSLVKAENTDAIKLECWKVDNLQRPNFETVMKQAKWQPAKVGDSFGPSWATVWFKVTLDTSKLKEWNGQPVWFVWDANCEGLIYSIDGIPQMGLTGGQGGDKRHVYNLFNSFPNSILGNTFYIELACNGMFGVATTHNIIGPANPNRYFTLATCKLLLPRLEAWKLKYDFEIVKGMVDAPELRNTDRGHKAVECLSRVMNVFQGFPPDGTSQDLKLTEDSIKTCQDIMNQFFSSHNGDDAHKVVAIGHCHIDTAWLWPYDETKRKCARSFASQLYLFERFPEHKFACSQMQQLEWMKLEYPKLWEKILIAVEQGKFIPVGGTWVEMDCNIPSGEAFIRQFLYGQRFAQQHFQKLHKLFWLPDTFGYSAQLPQIWRHCGGEWFFTQKLSWNNINKFPHTTFYWHSLDGTPVLTHFSPADTYNAQINPQELLFTTSNNKDLASTSTSLLLFGNGDGGGGPTVEMLERLDRLKDCGGMGCKVEIGDPEQFYGELQRQAEENSKGAGGGGLPRWKGELYFELHRGTYTSQAHNKYWNRKGEYLLHNVEFLSLIANKLFKLDYPKSELDRLWKLLLLNQFHDVLPGSSIGLVYEDSKRHYADIASSTGSLLDQALDSLVKGLQVKGSIVFNTTPFNQSGVVYHDSKPFYHETPMYGYSKASSKLPPTVKQAKVEKTQDGYILDNDILQAKFDNQGHLISLIHQGRQVMAGLGNRFKIFQDVPLFWDAWDVEIYHLEQGMDTPLDKTTLTIGKDEMSVWLQLHHQLSPRSTLDQRIILKSGSDVLEFDTKVDWNENRKFLKVEFPFDIVSDFATYESAFGVVSRPTHNNTSWDMAKFEVCGHKFADLSEWGYGVALLNDGKFGYSCRGNVMRLSLLRSPKAPDDLCDIGKHEFRYALYPHRGTFSESKVVEKGYVFNVLPIVKRGDVGVESFEAHSWFKVKGDSNVILDTIKRSEDGDDIVMRLYESLGGQGSVTIMTSLPVDQVKLVDGLERDLQGINSSGNEFNLSLRPFKIASIKLTEGEGGSSDGSWERV